MPLACLSQDESHLRLEYVAILVLRLAPLPDLFNCWRHGLPDFRPLRGPESSMDGNVYQLDSMAP
jgi:hypothetical protein